MALTFRPFQIDPATQYDGEEYAAYCRRRWGGDGWTRSLREAGKRDGVQFASWRTWPNTLHANRLVMLAGRHGLGAQVKSVLMRMCYEDGENVSLRSTCVRAAEEVGVPGGAAFVLGDEGIDELRAALSDANVNGKRVGSVPTYRIGAVDFSGAREVDHWLRILQAAAAESVGETG